MADPASCSAARPAPPPRCAWCGHVGPPVPVHGHLQCARCGTNVDPCCGGETASDDAAGDPGPARPG